MKKILILLIVVCLAFAGCGNNEEKIKKEKAFFKKLPNQYMYSSGMGSWGTYLNIKNDGSFTGKYYDKDSKNTGEKYQEGTVYICNFSGKFTDVTKVDESTYTMKINDLKTEKESEDYIQNDVRYISAKPYGLENADVLYVYLPDKQTSTLEEEYFKWDKSAGSSQKLNHYSIYNPEDKSIFVESD